MRACGGRNQVAVAAEVQQPEIRVACISVSHLSAPLPAAAAAMLPSDCHPIRPCPQATEQGFMVFDWKPECGTLLHVVPLLGGKVRHIGACCWC